MQPAYAALLAKKQAEGLIVRALITNLGLSQKHCAQVIGMAATTLNNIMREDSIHKVTLDTIFLTKYHLEQLKGKPNASRS